MLKRILKSLAPLALLVFVPMPAAAQPSLPGIEIRIAHSAPPPARYERIPSRPDRESVWIKGYSHWEGNRWNWVNGHWARPERASHRWIAPRYVREGNAWRYEQPHWSNQQVREGDEYRRWKEEHRRS